MFDFLKAASIRLRSYQKISDYYNKETFIEEQIKLNFKSYIKKQKAARDCQKLFDDSVKYNSNSSVCERKYLCDNKQRWITLFPKGNKPAIPYKKRIIVYSDVSFSEFMKEKFPAFIRRITGAIRNMSKDSQGKGEFIHVAWTFTS